MKHLKNFSQYKHLLITENVDEENELETQKGKSEYVGKKHKITIVDDIKNFIFAGNSIFTIESSQTGVWYTYKMKRADQKDENCKTFFVAVLRGPDNVNSYTYLGTVFDGNKFTLTKKSRFKDDTTCTKAFKFFFNNIVQNFIDHRLNFYHMGICGRCGRALTVPESITRGIGPRCALIMSGKIQKRTSSKYSQLSIKYPRYGNRQDDGDTSD